MPSSGSAPDQVREFGVVNEVLTYARFELVLTELDSIMQHVAWPGSFAVQLSSHEVCWSLLSTAH